MAEEYAPDAEEAAIAEDGEPELSDSYVDDEGIFNAGDEFYDKLDAEFEAMPTGARSGNQVAITNGHGDGWTGNADARGSGATAEGDRAVVEALLVQPVEHANRSQPAVALAAAP